MPGSATIRPLARPLGSAAVELAPDPADVDVEVVRLGVVRGAPDRPEQAALRQQPAAVGEHRLEQLVLARREVERLAVAADLPPDRVELQRPDPHDPLLVGLAAAGPAEERPDPRPQLGQPERLRDVVVGAELQGAHLGRLLAARREHEDRHRRLVADAGDHGEPVLVGQAEVEQDAVGPIGVPGRQRLGDRARDVDPEPVAAEVGRRRVPDRGLVLDEQQPRARLGHAGASSTGRAAAGRVRRTSSPPAVPRAASTVPPIASARPRTIVRPDAHAAGRRRRGRAAVEAVEQAPGDLVRHARAVVLDLDHDPVPGARGPQR